MRSMYWRAAPQFLGLAEDAVVVARHLVDDGVEARQFDGKRRILVDDVVCSS